MILIKYRIDENNNPQGTFFCKNKVSARRRLREILDEDPKMKGKSKDRKEVLSEYSKWIKNKTMFLNTGEKKILVNGLHILIDEHILD